MQAIDGKFIQKLPAATADMRPLPFPGRYPTRLWIDFGDHIYLGKPSCAQVNKIRARLFGKPAGIIEFIEFDRRAKFFGYSMDSGWLGTQAYFTWYHPGVPMGLFESNLGLWLGLPFRTLRVGKHTFYSTQPKTSDSFMVAQIESRQNPKAPVEAPGPKPTRPRPKSGDFKTYTLYATEYAKWKSENKEYLAWAKQQKMQQFDAALYNTKVPW